MSRFPVRRLLLPLLAAATVSAAPLPSYRVIRSIAAADGGWDYASVDSAAHRLYVARGDSVTVADLPTGTVHAIGSVARGHAVVPIPGQPLLMVTSGRDDSVRLLDTRDGHEVARIAVGSDPDAAFYDARTGTGVVMNAKAGTVSVIDLAKHQVSRTITLKPGLEFGVLGAGNTLFVNNEDANEIETADLTTGKAGPAIAMPGCEGPTGLAYDAKTARLISACANGKAIVVDARARRVIATLAIGNGPDAVILDAARRTAFVPCGKDGVLTMIALDGTPRVVGTVKTEVGARTGALDAADGTLYLPTARFGPPATPGGRPAALPGSFHVLVVARR